jgi:two-component system, cell cycle sensor histidine kinase and response regulator CckA
MVVDDDDANRYAKARVLRQAGYSVVEAANGGEALRQVTHDPPDLVLLDVRLPDVSGFEICRQIKANVNAVAIPVLQMSASFRDDQSKVTGLECGADGYITEPVESSVLVATIAAFLRTRRAEQAVRERALEWQATFDAIADGVALVDTKGGIVRSNRALGSLLNRPAGELIGANLDQFFSPAAGDPDIWHGLETGQRQLAERSAGERSFTLAVDPVRDPDGQLSGGVCIVCNVTESKLMKERLWHKQKLESIGLLAGGVAHDFNNLLLGILGNATLALEALTDPQSTERALRDIVRASERAADLTRQLLAYAGKGKFVMQPVDLSGIVTGMLPLVKASYSRKVDLILNLDDNLPAVKADKAQIEQIVMNLLINAAEAIGEGAGTVTVTTKLLHFAEDQRGRYLSENEVRGSYVSMIVSDDGIGMDEKTVRQIFDPFFTTKFMGRGLGLSAVLGIVRGHRGAIRVVSAPGRGATFDLLFPSAGTVPNPKVANAAVMEDGRARGGTILVVDDEPMVRDYYKLALERHGYEVVLANDGAEALQIFAQKPERFSAVLLDMVMPVMSGKEVLPRLLDLRPETRVVVTSGQMEEEVRSDLGKFSIAGFIQKPCASQTLVRNMRKFTGADTQAAG